MTPQIHISAESARQFDALIAETMRHTRQTLPKLLKWSAQQVTWSARADTRMAKRKRPTYADPRFSGWLRDIYSQGKPARPYVTKKRSHPTNNVPRVGTARNVFAGIYRKLGKNATPEGDAIGDAFGRVSDRLLSESPSVTLTSELGYMPIINPNAWQVGIDKTVKQLEYRLSKQAIKANAWR